MRTIIGEQLAWQAEAETLAVALSAAIRSDASPSAYTDILDNLAYAIFQGWSAECGFESDADAWDVVEEFWQAGRTIASAIDSRAVYRAELAHTLAIYGTINWTSVQS
jgi:hypothetical protein